MEENKYGIPTSEEFLSNKKINDRIYGYMKIHSENCINDKGEKIGYILKTLCSARRIKEYLQEQNKQYEIDLKVPSENNIREVIKLLCAAGWIYESIMENRKVYILPKLEGGTFVEIKAETLRYLVNTANRNVIKTYAYLKLKYWQYCKYHKEKNPYQYWLFSKKSLLTMLGYEDTDKAENLQKMEDILVCLYNNGLIDYLDSEYTPTSKGNVTKYYTLLIVREDYTRHISTKRKINEQPIPVKVEFSF